MTSKNDYDRKNTIILLVNLLLLLGLAGSIIMIIVSLFRSHWGPALAWLVMLALDFLILQVTPNPLTRGEVEIKQRRAEYNRQKLTLR